jgi:hypothetical protein
MANRELGSWLRRLRGAATFVYIAGLCVAVALLVIGFIPGSPVTLELPAALLSGLEHVGGVVPGAHVDPGGTIAFTVTDPSLAQRMFYLATTLPGVLLVAEVARRMARLLRAGVERDPFTAETVQRLMTVARITAFGGVGVWAVSNLAIWALSSTVLSSGTATRPHQSPLGWIAVGFIFAAFAELINRGLAMRAELDTVI